TACIDPTRSERPVRPYNERIRARLATHRIQRFRRGHSDPSSLSGRQAPHTVVRRELSSVLVDDRPRFWAQPVAREELAVVAACEEARLLALGPPGRGQPGALGLGACLVLRLLPEREPDPVQKPRVEPREHVRLILLRVRSARQYQSFTIPDDPRCLSPPQP